VDERPAERSETDGIVAHEIRIAAEPATVFAYFTDPAKMVEWMGTEATLDPRPGGICRINPSGQGVMLGEFLEVDPPHRVVFTWGWESAMFATPPQSTVVEVSLTPDGHGTLVQLAHRRLHPQALAIHRAGWDHYLPRLALVAAGAKPEVDPWRNPEIAARDLRAAGVSLPVS
jgi:uncharacterized protein YndB with AHSA1/START domain